VNDGLVHHAALTLSAGGALTLYLDGTNVGSAAGVGLTASDATVFSVAPDLGFASNYVGTVAHAAVYPTDLLGAVISTRFSNTFGTPGANSDYTSESPAARILRVARYCGLTTAGAIVDSAGGTVCGPANQGGRSALDVINEVADATQGFVYLDGAGRIGSVNGYTVAAAVTPAVTLDALYADQGTVVEADMAFVINEVNGGSTASENTSTARQLSSINTHGLHHQDFTWNVSSDSQATDRTNWIVNTYASPAARFPSLTLDVLTMGSSDTTAALLLDVSKFLRLTGLPTQAGTTTFDLIVQGITWNLSAEAFTIDLNCAQHNLYEAWILGDAVHGVLGATTKLYAA
jgi:hypothetical protein